MTRKNYIFPSLISLLILSSLIFAGTQFLDFKAHSESGNMVLEWQTDKEVEVKSFTILRSTPNGPFYEVGTIQARGDYSFYRFVDEGVYKTSSNVYRYKVRINDGNPNPGYSQTISSTVGSVSGFKSTWGSIKALFR